MMCSPRLHTPTQINVLFKLCHSCFSIDGRYCGYISRLVLKIRRCVRLQNRETTHGALRPIPDKPSPERKVATSLVRSLKHCRDLHETAQGWLPTWSWKKRDCASWLLCASLANQTTDGSSSFHTRVNWGCFEAPILVWFVLNWCSLQHG